MPVNTDGDMSDPQSDAIWILSSTIVVLTMQSGFGLLESGSVSVKNELNIMVKNAVDVVFGGMSYWLCGYGFSFGDHAYSNAFVGWGHFLVNADEDKLGEVYSKFFFQASFATTATTIVSGAMAERTKLTSYVVFSMINTVLFSIPAHWMWAPNGWLYSMGVIDIAGAGPVHVVGGVTGLVATLILKPRHGRYTNGAKGRTPQMSSPTNAVLGMFMLWWGWLGFNCGSTFGISGVKWKLAARSAATTLCASVSGGAAGFTLSYIVKDRKFDVTYIINGLLGSLVSVTAVCAVVQPWEGIVIGFIGSGISNAGVALLDKLKIDDPVGCVGTHALSGSWGMLAAGLFLRKDAMLNELYLHGASAGLFYGGGFYQLGIQALALVAIVGWTVIVSYICLKLIQLTMGLRVSLEEEIIGADIIEHGIGELVYDRKTKTLSYPDHYDNEAQEMFNELVPGGANNNNSSALDRTSHALLQQHTHLLGHHGNGPRAYYEINKQLQRHRALNHSTGLLWRRHRNHSNDGVLRQLSQLSKCCPGNCDCGTNSSIGGTGQHGQCNSNCQRGLGPQTGTSTGPNPAKSRCYHIRRLLSMCCRCRDKPSRPSRDDNGADGTVDIEDIERGCCERNGHAFRNSLDTELSYTELYESLHSQIDQSKTSNTQWPISDHASIHDQQAANSQSKICGLSSVETIPVNMLSSNRRSSNMGCTNASVYVPCNNDQITHF